MKKVNVYIYSGIRTIKKSDGAAGYVLSYMTKNDIEATLSNIVYLEDVTRHEAELEVLNQALSRLNTKEIEIDIYTDSSYLTSALDLDWIHKWQQSGWKNSKCEPVRLFDLRWGLLLSGELPQRGFSAHRRHDHTIHPFFTGTQPNRRV